MARGDHYDERLNDPTRVRLLKHADLLLRLRNEPDLVKAVIERQKLSAPPSDVAIHVDVEGPTGVFTLKAERKTCLAERSAINDAHIVPHTVLFSVINERDDLAARYAAAQRLTGEESPAGALFERIVHAGRNVSREDFYAFAWFAPTLGPYLYTLYEAGISGSWQRALSLRYKRRAERWAGPLLAGYEKYFFRLGHLAMTIGLGGRRMIQDGQLAAPDACERLVSDLIRLGTLGAALRGAWIAGKLGNAVMQILKKRYQRAKTTEDLGLTAAPLLALATRHSNLRPEITKALLGPLPYLAPAAVPFAKQLKQRIEPIAKQLRSGEPMDCSLLRLLGLLEYQRLTETLPSDSPYRHNHFDRMPADLACGVLADSTTSIYSDDAYWQFLALAPQIALQEPESFYLPQELLTVLGREWTTEDSIRLARKQTGTPDPVRAQPRPGRNELCPCGSEKKYKRCCG
ncbi:MAG: SEC-C metal-binding domain-containing protein [Polyangia bacterium]